VTHPIICLLEKKELTTFSRENICKNGNNFSLCHYLNVDAFPIVLKPFLHAYMLPGIQQTMKLRHYLEGLSTMLNKIASCPKIKLIITIKLVRR